MSRGKAVDKIAVKASLAARDSAVDPVLASLFTTSSGPVIASTSRTKSQRQEKNTEAKATAMLSEEQDDESEATSNSDTSASEDEQEGLELRPRKKRRLSQTDDLETTYLNRLVREEQKEISERLKQKQHDTQKDAVEDASDSESSASNDLEDLSDVELEDAIPKHESLTKSTTEYEKTRRTIFLSNVSIEAIRSKASRRQLEAHLKSVLNIEAQEQLESLRFRSTAYDVAAGPRRAAYAKKELMDETTKSTNAYVVFNTEAVAKKVAKTLNGTVVLDRHLHTDWLAHPTAIDHHRCVFVGNLNFVNLESNIDTAVDGEKQKRPSKTKEPADAEEGLWRTFSRCGPVESVRVIRDRATRVGKGIAYVQFSDEVSVEKALALDGKKFPPLLPRLLRVSRAKKIAKKDLKRKRDENADHHHHRRGHQSSKNQQDGTLPNNREGRGKGRLNGVVFEGYRATATKDMKFKTKGKKKKGVNTVRPSNRSSRRGAAFKASGGKKKRDAK